MDLPNMIYPAVAPDAAAFYSCSPQGKSQSKVSRYFDDYQKARDADTMALKSVYYGVVLHGWPTVVIPDEVTAGRHENWTNAANYSKTHWRPANLAEALQGRAARYLNAKPGILLMSCYTGQRFAGPFASLMSRFVLAPCGPCEVQPNGQVNIFEVGAERTYGPVTNAKITENAGAMPGPFDAVSLGAWALYSPEGALIDYVCGAVLNKAMAVRRLRALAADGQTADGRTADGRVVFTKF